MHWQIDSKGVAIHDQIERQSVAKFGQTIDSRERKWDVDMVIGPIVRKVVIAVKRGKFREIRFIHAISRLEIDEAASGGYCSRGAGFPGRLSQPQACRERTRRFPL